MTGCHKATMLVSQYNTFRKISIFRLISKLKNVKMVLNHQVSFFWQPITYANNMP